MDDGTTLRPAADGDRPALLRIWRRAVEATHGFLTPADVDEIEEQVRAAALPALALTVAQRSDGALLGWVGVHGDRRARAVRVEALFVDPAAHRLGVGTALLGAATPAMGRVELDVNEQNPSALAFYERHGFVRVGRSERDGEGRPFPLLHLRRG
ncbi:GNAT family N-acetyltransferase [Pseudonocardia broussonetiae]|uniref:GNAT family N-acetyltransferase n=1 Tax=Pseudonocardia broussonetiae TaxID=2736640 RepID=UPI001F03F750|nr:GNAT family N-acetyltransferase [Pseudonocardia broussonetiae]